jgi:UDP-N-acetylglucosamine--N-acetylmuramyl-(pentapeptide) pyrophosphoryl-undecaprenol N-acetylglucosamine transferase
MKVLIVTGGTGGHIYPALSFAELIMDRFTDAELLFVGNQGRMEANLIPQAGYQFRGLNTQSIGGNLLNRALGYVHLFRHSKEIDEIFLNFKPDWCIGFGGYVSVPVLLKALKLKIPYFIHEQNAFVGKANRLLSKHAKAIFASYPENLKVFPKHKTNVVGNPRSYSIKIDEQEQVLKQLGLNSLKPTVLFVMGSQGAESLYSISIDVMHILDAHEIQSVFVTGNKYYENFISLCHETQNIKIVPYINQIAIMKEVSCMVTRGGATTASEIALLGTPSIIVPSPYVPNNHQYYNAKALVDAEAALLIEEKSLTKDNLSHSILNLLNDHTLMQKISMAALKMAKPNAAQDMLNNIMKVLP